MSLCGRFSDRGQRTFGSKFRMLSLVSLDVRSNIKLPAAASFVHVTDLSCNLSFSPTLVVESTDGPHAVSHFSSSSQYIIGYIPSHIAVWISSIQVVAIVQIDGNSQCFRRRFRPL